MSNTPNKIQRLQLENFTCFERADMTFSNGINVFIGENGTGKTHLLKMMYGSINHFVNNTPSDMKDFVRDLIEYFRVEKLIKLGRLFKKQNIDFKAVTQLSNGYEARISGYSIGSKPVAKTRSNIQLVFLPLFEMLSWQKGFQSLYAKREVSFDKTYYDLAVALGLGKLKNSALAEAEALAAEIREAIKADVIQRDERFYFKFEDMDEELEAPVVAQGINKLGQLYYLILNGSLTKDTVLFWDEPETGLNPKYIKIVAQFLQTLAKAGVQIFVATHDYLLTHHLSLAAEYREQTDAPDMKFFALYKGENGTEVETGSNLTEIQNDAILDEYAAYYDLENEYFKKTVVNS